MLLRQEYPTKWLQRIVLIDDVDVENLQKNLDDKSLIIDITLYQQSYVPLTRGEGVKDFVVDKLKNSYFEKAVNDNKFWLFLLSLYSEGSNASFKIADEDASKILNFVADNFSNDEFYDAIYLTINYGNQAAFEKIISQISEGELNRFFDRDIFRIPLLTEIFRNNRSNMLGAFLNKLSDDQIEMARTFFAKITKNNHLTRSTSPLETMKLIADRFADDEPILKKLVHRLLDKKLVEKEIFINNKALTLLQDLATSLRRLDFDFEDIIKILEMKFIRKIRTDLKNEESCDIEDHDKDEIKKLIKQKDYYEKAKKIFMAYDSKDHARVAETLGEQR